MPLNSSYFADEVIQQFVSRFDAVIFDMNGLIVDDEPLQLAAYNEVLRDYSLQIPQEWWVGNCLGRKAGQFMRQYLTQSGQAVTLFDEILPRKEAAYGRMLRETGRSILRPGVVEFIDYLQTEQVAIALATSAYRFTAEFILGTVEIDLARTFPIATFGDQVTHGKPDPELFLKTQAQLPAGGKCVVLEDSPPGLTGAKAAGMACVAVPNSFTCKCDLSAADLILSDLSPRARRL
jgi:HAD superfamily hydrolase (TIGR01509 family)